MDKASMELIPNPSVDVVSTETSAASAQLSSTRHSTVATTESKSDQPRWEEGTIHEIEVSATVQQFGCIDTIAQTFMAKLWIDVWWLPSEKEAEAGEPSEWDIEGGFQMVGSVECEQGVSRGPDLKMVGGREMFHAVYEIKGVFNMSPDLRHFPFDVQVVTVTAEMGNFKNVAYFPPRHMDACVTATDTLAEWAMENIAISFTASDVALSKSGNRYAQLQLVFVLRREWEPYFYRVIGQVAVMCFASVSVYAIPVHDVGDRLGYLFTIILTLVAFQMAIADTIPQTPYLTWLDKYLAGANTILFAAVLITTVLGWHGAEYYEDVDFDCFIIMGGVTLGSQFFWLFYAMWSRYDAILSSLDQKKRKKEMDEVYGAGNEDKSVRHLTLTKGSFDADSKKGTCFTFKNW